MVKMLKMSFLSLNGLQLNALNPTFSFQSDIDEGVSETVVTVLENEKDIDRNIEEETICPIDNPFFEDYPEPLYD